MRLIDADALYEQIAKKEELAVQRVLDTPSRMPNGDFNPSAMRYATQLDERTQMRFMIADAPTIDTEPHWIPCSERLPEERDWYLGIFKEPDTGWINPLPFICDYVGSETKATTKEHWILRGFTDRDERIDYYFNLECVAWLPLPEPFREERLQETV